MDVGVRVPRFHVAVLVKTALVGNTDHGFIGGYWGPASISALAAIFGSLSGALASSVSTWITQKHHGRRDILTKRIFYCEQSNSCKVNCDKAPRADTIGPQSTTSKGSR